MKIINYKNFKKNIAANLKLVNSNHEILIVSRTKGRAVVIMDEDDYNSQQETLYLLSTKANRIRLEAALAEMKNKF